MKHLLKDSLSGVIISPKDIRDLRQRLSPDSTKPLSQQQFSELLGVSWSTVARWERGGRPDQQMGRKLARLQRTLNALGEMIKREYRLAFFNEHPPPPLHRPP